MVLMASRVKTVLVFIALQSPMLKGYLGQSRQQLVGLAKYLAYQLGNTSGLRQSGTTQITLAKLDTRFQKSGNKGLKAIKATLGLKETKGSPALRVLMVKPSTPTIAYADTVSGSGFSQTDD